MAIARTNASVPTSGLGKFLRSNRLCRMGGPAASRPPQIEIPEMTGIPGMPNKRIMKGELTVGLFKQIMEGYEITGSNADQLKAILADPFQAGNALTCVSLLDAREFAKRLSELTGRKFRVQTEAEWERASSQLSGNNFTWTEDKYSEKTYVLRHLVRVSRIDFDPGTRHSNFAVRLVEDL